MKLKILLFGISTDIVGTDSLDFELPENSTVQSLKDVFQNQYSGFSKISSYAIAVNESYATDDTVLRENDVVAVIPPVSGG